jgi:hypothetical protein
MVSFDVMFPPLGHRASWQRLGYNLVNLDTAFATLSKAKDELTRAQLTTQH